MESSPQDPPNTGQPVDRPAEAGREAIARLLDANLDRAREGLRVIEDWCRFGLDRDDLVARTKDLRQRLGLLHEDRFKQARHTASDPAAGLGHPAQESRRTPSQVVAANCARVQEALRVLEEFARSEAPELARQAAAGRYALYDLELAVLRARQGGHERRAQLAQCRLYLITSPSPQLEATVAAALEAGVRLVQYRSKDAADGERWREARALRQLCARHGALFIVNDRLDLALALDADGVHLGQGDLPRRGPPPARAGAPDRPQHRRAGSAAPGGGRRLRLRGGGARERHPHQAGPGAHRARLRAPGGERIADSLLRHRWHRARHPGGGAGGGGQRVAVVRAITGAADPGQASRDLLAALA